MLKEIAERAIADHRKKSPSPPAKSDREQRKDATEQKGKGKEKTKAKIKVIYTPTVVTDTFLAEEVWDRIHSPKYLKYTFETGKIEEMEGLYLGEVDEKGRKIICKPINNDAIRKGFVIVPERATPCTFAEVL